MVEPWLAILKLYSDTKYSSHMLLSSCKYECSAQNIKDLGFTFSVPAFFFRGV